jgi:hypothetical protein
MSKTSRRAILAGLAAAPAAALPALADDGELAALITAYSKAHEAFTAACGELERAEDAWTGANSKGFLVPSFVNGAIESRFGIEECKKWISDSYSRSRDALKGFAKIAPEQAAQMRQALDAKEAENLALVDRLFEEEEERKEAFGLGPAERRWRQTCDAEDRAALALCSYPCRSLEEARIKAAVILGSPIVDGVDEELLTAFLQSFAPDVAPLEREARS